MYISCTLRLSSYLPTGSTQTSYPVWLCCLSPEHKAKALLVLYNSNSFTVKTRILPSSYFNLQKKKRERMLAQYLTGILGHCSASATLLWPKTGFCVIKIKASKHRTRICYHRNKMLASWGCFVRSHKFCLLYLLNYLGNFCIIYFFQQDTSMPWCYYFFAKQPVFKAKI